MKFKLHDLLKRFQGTTQLAPLAVGIQGVRVLNYDCHCGSDDCSGSYDCHCSSDDCSVSYDCHCGSDDCSDCGPF